MALIRTYLHTILIPTEKVLNYNMCLNLFQSYNILLTLRLTIPNKYRVQKISPLTAYEKNIEPDVLQEHYAYQDQCRIAHNYIYIFPLIIKKTSQLLHLYGCRCCFLDTSRIVGNQKFVHACSSVCNLIASLTVIYTHYIILIKMVTFGLRPVSYVRVVYPKFCLVTSIIVLFHVCSSFLYIFSVISSPSDLFNLYSTCIYMA